ncbi:LTA synthase family protein [Symmachiella macrocystis]|uniref:LTA synthase family protein n=1 Tax=Symmachiella macrocystis TaxID=2527985 RepID=UPI0018D2E877|nr:alkaline phosphatase family protein [Symmachiella macrocystis]
MAISCLLIVLWASENFLLQALTLISDAPSPESALISRPIKRSLVRATINLLSASVIVLLAPRWLLRLVIVLDGIASIILYAYFDYFSFPLSWTVMVNQSTEGATFTDSLLALIPPGIAVGITICIALNLALISLRDRYLKPTILARQWGIRIGICYFTLVFVLVAFIRPMSGLATWHSLSHIGSLYGYTISWGGESAYRDNENLLQMANEAAKVTSDKLANIEPDIGFNGHIVIIQVESLDYAILNSQVNNRWVMPRLRRLLSGGISYEIEAVHQSGSSDADFVMLTGRLPVGIVAPYRVDGFEYKDCLPHLAKTHGYETVSLHGNRGTFFSRRACFQQMGFDRLLFQEELVTLGLPESDWGIEDSRVFEMSSDLIEQSTQPQFHFLVTLTTHTPFSFLPANAPQLFSESTSMLQKYCNNMYYMDRILCDYLQRLPEQTTVVIYGDHDSRVKYESKGDTTLERVPFAIIRVGEQIQQNRLQETNVAIGLLDCATYVRRQFGVTPARRPR